MLGTVLETDATKMNNTDWGAEMTKQNYALQRAVC